MPDYWLVVGFACVCALCPCESDRHDSSAISTKVVALRRVIYLLYCTDYRYWPLIPNHDIDFSAQHAVMWRDSFPCFVSLPPPPLFAIFIFHGLTTSSCRFTHCGAFVYCWMCNQSTRSHIAAGYGNSPTILTFALFYILFLFIFHLYVHNFFFQLSFTSN